MLVANNFAFQKLDEIPRSTFQGSILSQETRPLEYTVSPWLMRLLVLGKIRISQILHKRNITVVFQPSLIQNHFFDFDGFLQFLIYLI